MNRLFTVSAAFVFLAGISLCQSSPQSDPQGVTLASQSITAMTGGTSISDVTLTGTVTWNGSDAGTATLLALGTGESRMDLALSSGTRTEIRDAQTAVPLGQWINPDSTSGYFAPQNCWTDAAWFFPALGSLTAGENVVLSYVGQEIWNGASVQHLQSSMAGSGNSRPPTPQQLSVMDFYLDADTSLPSAVVFNTHPDNDPSTNLVVEIDFANYQTFNGIAVPTHIQRYQQGNLLVDISINAASANTGLVLSQFAIN